RILRSPCADPNALNARILALAGLEVDSSGAQTREHFGREFRYLAVEVASPSDEVRRRQRALHRPSPIERRDQRLGDEGENRIAAGRADRAGETAVPSE